MRATTAKYEPYPTEHFWGKYYFASSRLSAAFRRPARHSGGMKNKNPRLTLSERDRAGYDAGVLTRHNDCVGPKCLGHEEVQQPDGSCE